MFNEKLLERMYGAQEILTEIKVPDAFNTYDTKDNGLLIPSQNFGVLLIVDKASIGIETLSRLNIGRQLNTLYLPKQITLYNKSFNLDKSNYIDDANRMRLNIVDNPQVIDSSFITDITPYLSFMFNSLNIYKYANEALKFINNSIASLNNVIPQGVISKWIILYVMDSIFISENKMFDKQLYGYTFIKNLMSNHEKKEALGSLINDVYLYAIASNGGAVVKIYNKDTPVDYMKAKRVFTKIKPNLIISDAQNSNTSNNPNEDNEETAVMTPEELKEKQLLLMKQRAEMQQAYNQHEVPQLDNIQALLKNSKQLSMRQNNVTIQKINDDQYDKNREIPILDNEDEENVLVNKNNDKMFPFLNNTKKADNNISDSARANIREDNETNILSLLSDLVPRLTNDKTQEKTMRDILYSKFLRDPDLFKKCLECYHKQDMNQLLIYINHDELPYQSKIYPHKDQVDRSVIKELDTWSNDNGYVASVSNDPVLNSNTISNIVPSNMHRVIAQKKLTWDRMPQEIERYISPVLEDNGFQLVGISMFDKQPPITQIEPTYKSEIRIRVRNKTTKKAQTLVFDVLTLIEGKYHISGGIPLSPVI